MILEIDLTPFCSTEGESWAKNTRRPFVQGGWRYATNFVVCIRLPAPGEPDTPAENGGMPDAGDVFFYFHAAPHGYAPWPKDGMKRDVGRQVGAHLIASDIAQRIITLPNVRYAVAAPLAAADGPAISLPFIFGDSGEGLVMGLRDGTT